MGGTGARAETFSDVLQRLSTSASKTNRGAPAYTRWVNRPLGRRVAAWSFLHGLTPNQLTAANTLAIFPVFLAFGLFPPRSWWTVPAAGVLLAAYVLDSADGQLARLRGGGSKAGEFLDHVVDAVKTSTVHAVVCVAWFRFYDLPPAWLLVPLAFGVIHSGYYFSHMLTDGLRRLARVQTNSAPEPTAANTEAPVLRSLVKLPTDWGTQCFVLMLLPWPLLFVTAYVALFAANCLFTFVGWVQWYRDLATL